MFPTNRSERFYDSLHEFSIPSAAFIVGGDFNCYDNALDKFGGNVSIHHEYDLFKRGFDLLDVWRKLHPRERKFTWFNSNLSITSRLDKFLISNDLFSLASKCKISPCPLSDHDFVSLVFEIPDSIKRGPGTWKLNNSLLDENNFCEVIRKLIADHISFLSALSSFQDWWNFLKQSIKEEYISFSCWKRRSAKFHLFTILMVLKFSLTTKSRKRISIFIRVFF